MRTEATAAGDAPVEEPAGFLHAVVDGQGRRTLPLFRRAAAIVVGRSTSCQWRFNLPSLADEQLRLVWDGVRLKVEELDPGCATRLDGGPLHAGLHPVRPGQPIVAGELALEFELQLFSDEVTQIRRIVLPPEAAAPARHENGAADHAAETAAAETAAHDAAKTGAAVADDRANRDDEQLASTVIATMDNPASEPGPPPPEAPPPPATEALAPPSLVTEALAPPSLATEALAPSPLATEALAPPSSRIDPPRAWRCYVPPRNGAADDEPTVAWPEGDALRPTADLLERLSQRSLGRVPRRLAALLGILVVVSVATLWLSTARRPPSAPPVSEPGATRFDEATRAESRAMQPDKDLEVTLRQGIEAYRRGRTADAVDHFRRLSEATGDPSARLMMFILRTRGAATP